MKANQRLIITVGISQLKVTHFHWVSREYSPRKETKQWFLKAAVRLFFKALNDWRGKVNHSCNQEIFGGFTESD